MPLVLLPPFDPPLPACPALLTEPDLKKRIRVHLLNAHGLDEAGIDGGGIFREFLNELLKSGFNPNQGFFKTTNEGLLYPNPAAQMLVGDSFARHYYFLGTMLGKVTGFLPRGSGATGVGTCVSAWLPAASSKVRMQNRLSSFDEPRGGQWVGLHLNQGGRLLPRRAIRPPKKKQFGFSY